MTHTVASIKAMSTRDRNKITKEELLTLILSIEDPPNQNDLAESINTLSATINLVKDEAMNNKVMIIQLQTENKEIMKRYEIQDEQIKKLSTDNEGLRGDLEEMNQYLRINNLEIIGLPSIQEMENEDIINDEQILLQFFNSKMGVDITEADIDISHEIPTRRKDKRRVVVCRFVSRKTKIKILNARKEMCGVRFNGNEVFVNEHLSPFNRELFALATGKKKTEHFKYLWVRNGNIYLRKNDNSEIHHIINKNILNSAA